MAENLNRRSKSSIARSLLQRVSSKTDVPTLQSSITSAGPSNISLAASSLIITSHADGFTNTTDTPTDGTQKYQAEDESSGASLERLVNNLGLVNALTSGDTAVLSNLIASEKASGIDGQTILHLAVEMAEVATVENVLKIGRGRFVDTPNKSGNAPLHLAAIRGEPLIVRALLVQPGVNEARLNRDDPPKTALDFAGERRYFNEKVYEQLQAVRSQRVETQLKSHIEKVRGYITSGSYEPLGQFLSEPAVKNALDVNDTALADSRTRASGGSLLHEAARRHDTRLIDTLLMNGADPFRRDVRGNLPRDVTKDPKTRAMLKKSPAAAAAQRGIQEKLILGSSATKRAPGETAVGSKEAREMKGYLKKWTNYTSGFKLRWFVLEDGVLSYYEHQDDAGSACRGAINMRIAKLTMDPKEKRCFDIHGKSSVKYSLKADHEVEAKRWFWALNNAIQYAKDEERQQQKKTAQSIELSRSAPVEYLNPAAHSLDLDESISGRNSINETLSTHMTNSISALDEPAGSTYDPSILGDDMGHETAASDDEDSAHELRTNSRADFNVPAQAATIQLGILAKFPEALISAFVSIPAVSEALLAVYPTSSEAEKAVYASMTPALAPFASALKTQAGFIEEMRRIHYDNDASWKAQFSQQTKTARWWEENVSRFAKEHEDLQAKIGETEDKLRKAKRALRDTLDTQPDDGATKQSQVTQDVAGIEAATVGLQLTDSGKSNVDGSGRPRRRTIAEITNNAVSDDESDMDDEFFDAVDAGEVEVREDMPTQEHPLQHIDTSVANKQSDVAHEIEKSYKGYENGPRQKLKLDKDNRPKVSLWGVLKSMVGKDMTKMTLPVSFNEPTSLLYRVVEDMEYADVLNTAAERADSTERLVYVAAFAASIYASSIGRVAKPFNPLLGETYEYVRPDKGYRFFIEQVSHHPPVGAAYAESAKWDYYGESNIKSKFYGKSFEFNHLGKWFLHLRPDSSPVEEVYSWKKVTSTVVGIITGNPQVDNYGPMEIRNHTTGETCLLDFKARGWRANSAFVITGKVLDAQGNVKWSIGGRWNDKIYARNTPGYQGDVEPPTASAPGQSPTSRGDQAFLVWEAHPRPNVPFNLTSFAVTLNDDDPHLLQHVAPTDSRLRPDQRCLELGEYDRGAIEKNRLEEKQRATRRKREQAGEEFIPRWFVQERHPVTGEMYWGFDRSYWDVREKVDRGDRKWADEGLEDIF